MSADPEPATEPEPPPRKEERTLTPQPVTAVRVLKSVAIVGVCFAALIAVSFTLPVSLALIGVTQLVVAVPLIVWARRRGDTVLLRVTLIGASLVFLLNATCFGILIFGGGIH